MPRVFRVVAFLGLVACAAGCGHRPIGELGRTAFTHDDRSYAIVYADASSRTLLGSDWKLENALPPDDDELEYKPGQHPKWGFDGDEDGRADVYVEVPRPDLRFIHLKHGGVIFVRSMPLDVYEESLGLDVLGEHMAEAMSGARWYAASRDSSAVGIERRAAVLTERSQVVTVSGAAGKAFTYDFADVDQLQMNPDARIGKMELVLLRPGLPYAPERWSGRKGKGWKPSPLMLVVGYWNVPSRFDEGYVDFEGLLQRVAFTGRAAGMQRGPVEGGTSAAPASEPSAAPASEPSAAPASEPSAAPASEPAPALEPAPTATQP